MPRPHLAPRHEERPFQLDELFFSTTDWRGVIQSGNRVFLRVAGFSAIEEVLGKPHSVIRHPDMPRAVFRLLWQYLGRGQGIAAYVKNLATDGRYYWVMALAVPTSGGYLSVRFKPTSEIFALVQGLYAEMLAAEAEAGDREEGIRASTALLLAALKSRGFADYDEFMQVALAAELSARRRALGPRGRRAGALAELEEPIDELFAEAETFLGLIAKLDKLAASLARLSRRVHLLSLNALIASCRLADAGRGLAVVTDNLAACSKDMSAYVADMTRGMRAMAAALRRTSFTLAAARLQVEMAIQFGDELAGAEDARARADSATLLDSLRSSTGRLVAALPENRGPVAALVRHGERLSEAQMMLASVHVIGRVEATAVGVEELQVLFAEVLEQLQVTQMDEMSAILATLRHHLRRFEGAGFGVERALAAAVGSTAGPAPDDVEERLAI